MIIREASIKYTNIVKAENITLDNPEKVANYVKKYLEFKDDYDPEIEHFWVIILDRRNKAKAIREVTKGTATASLVHPREVFRCAVMESACAVAVVHNHPSGDPAPSRADIQVTRRLKEASKILDIDFLDHIVIGDKDSDPNNKGYYSFNDAGLI